MDKIETEIIQIREQHSQGAILASRFTSEIDYVNIFPVHVTVSVGLHYRKWRVTYWLPSLIKKMEQENKDIRRSYYSFDTKPEAEICALKLKTQLVEELKQCEKEGGMRVYVEWLRTKVSPNRLQKHIRLAKSLKAMNYKENQSQLSLDAYFLGLWLGDGTSANANITTMDPEIVDYLQNLAKRYCGHWKWVVRAESGRAKTYAMHDASKSQRNNIRKHLRPYLQPFFQYMTLHPKATLKEIKYAIEKSIPFCESSIQKWRARFKKGTFNMIAGNPIRIALSELNLINNKHIPEMYFQASRENRLKLLAGLLDTDAYLKCNCYEITQKSIPLSNDIQRLATELGFFVFRRTKLATCSNGVSEESKTGIPVERMSILGLNLDRIPCLVPRKKFHSIVHHHLPLITFSDCKPINIRERKRKTVGTKEQDSALSLIKQHKLK